MHFFKKNLVNIIISTLLIGALGTFISAFSIPQTYNYEEHYIFNDESSADQYAQNPIKVNENIIRNQGVPVEIDHLPESNTVVLNIHEATSNEISALVNGFAASLEAKDLYYSGAHYVHLQPLDNTVPKVLAIVGSLFCGSLFGLLFSLNNRKVVTDEDTKYYLGEKTLGTF